MQSKLLIAIFTIGAVAGPHNLFKRQETCYQVDCNINTGDCQGTLPDCERGYCIEDPIICQYVCFQPFQFVNLAHGYCDSDVHCS